MLLCSTMVQSQDLLCDEHGRTELMNDVIFHEEQIASMKAVINELWHVCYKEEQVLIGSYQHKNGYIQNIYDTKIRRKPSCTDEDINRLKFHEETLVCYINDAVSGIKAKIQESDCQLYAHDNEGKTVINYCRTYKIYQVLMDHGAPFQIAAWIHFNSATTILYAATATTAVIFASYLAFNYYYNQSNVKTDVMPVDSVVQQEIVSLVQENIVPQVITEFVYQNGGLDLLSYLDSMNLSY